MEIGTPQKTIEVQPAQEPFRQPERTPAPERERTPEPVKTPEKVPAGR